MSIFDEFEEESKKHGKNELKTEYAEKVDKSAKPKRINPNNYDPYTGTEKIMPKWFRIAVAVFMVLVIFAVGIIIGVFAINRPGDDLAVTNEIIKLLDKYYYGDIDWNNVDASTAQALLRSISNFNGISVTSGGGTTVFGFNHTGNEYGEHYILGVMPHSSASAAVGTRVNVSISFDTVKVTDILEENADLTKYFHIQRGDKVYAINTALGTNDAFKLIDGMNNDSFSSYTSMYNALQFIMERDTGAETVYYKILLTRGGAGATLSEYKNMADISTNENSNIGYISLSEFSEESLNAIYSSAKAFRNDSRANKLILDLRYNGGGRVDVLSHIAPLFIPHTNNNLPVMKLVNKNKVERVLNINTDSVNGISSAYLGDGKENFELVVLVNGSSASASEALVGVINYYNSDATIVGTDTYGKGVAQSIFELKVGGTQYEIAIVTDYYYLPTLYNGSMQWVNYHGKTVPIDYNFYDDAIYNGLSNEDRYNIARPYYDTTKEIVTAKAIEILLS